MAKSPWKDRNSTAKGENGTKPMNKEQQKVTQNAHRSQGSDLSNFIIRQHPAGDRYIITAKSETTEKCFTPGSVRSVQSTPGRLPSNLSSSRRSDASQDDYLEYYSIWRDIATSKTEKEAERLIMHAIQTSPMSRYVQSDMIHRRSESTKITKPKIVTMQDKRKQKLEKMKKVWRVEDRGAQINNSLSTEEFLSRSDLRSRDSVRNKQISSRASKHSSHRSREIEDLDSSALSSSRSGSRASRIPRGNHPSEPVVPLLSRDGKKMADKAKKALESIGICRPPTSRLSTQGSQGDQSLHGEQSLHEDHGAGLARSELLILTAEGHPQHRNDTLHADPHVDASPVETSVSSEQSFSDGRTWRLTGHVTHLETSWEETPRGNVDPSTKPRTSNMSPADSEMWEKELDELLEWTDQLCSL